MFSFSSPNPPNCFLRGPFWLESFALENQRLTHFGVGKSETRKAPRMRFDNRMAADLGHRTVG